MALTTSAAVFRLRSLRGGQGEGRVGLGIEIARRKDASGSRQPRPWTPPVAAGPRRRSFRVVSGSEVRREARSARKRPLLPSFLVVPSPLRSSRTGACLRRSRGARRLLSCPRKVAPNFSNHPLHACWVCAMLRAVFNEAFQWRRSVIRMTVL